MADQIDIDVNVNLNNAEEVDELSNKLQGATDSADNLSNSAENINAQSMGDAANEASNFGNETSNADNEVQNLSNDLGLINGAALLSVANEMNQLGQQAEGMSQEMNEAAITVGQLATQTGIAEPQMVELVNHISNATFPNDEAMMYVKSLDQIGVSSENLGQSATDLDKINDAFGMGAGKVNSLGQELSVLGVDMNDVSSSFNALAYANANTVGGMDNYYTFLRKYDSQFKELGLNVDQASVIIAGATQKFGGGRAALTGLNDALKESNGDTRALEEALGLQSGSISNATQLTGEYEGQLQTLADEEAEHKTMLDQIGAAWEDVTLSASGVLSPLGSFMGLIGQAGSFAVGVNGMAQLASNLTKLPAMINAVRTAESLSIGIKTALGIATGAEAVAEGGAAAAKSAAIAPTTGLAVAENSLLWPLLLIVGAVIAVIGVMWYLYNTNETVRNGINWLVAQIQAFINSLMPIVQAIITFVSQGLSNLGRLPGAIWNIFLTIIGYVASWASSFVQRGIQAATNFINNVGNALSGIGGRIQSALSGVFNYITKPFQDAYNFIYNNTIKPLEDAWNFLTGGFGDFEGYGDFGGYSGGDTLNNTLATIATSSSTSSMTVNNNFNGIVEESAADYIVGAVNDRLRREKLLKGG